MDMKLFHEKRKKLRLKHMQEHGDPQARELLNRSGFNRTPRMPEKPPTMTPGETLMRGHDVQERNDIPATGLYGVRAKEGSAPPDKAGLIPFEKQSDALKQNYQPQPRPMKHGKKIFAKDPNYNPEPTTPAPSGPGTKQTNAAVGSPQKSLSSYAGAPGGTEMGVSGKMATQVHGHTPTGPAPANFSHRSTEYAGEKAPSGEGFMPGKAQKSLAQYPGGGKKKRKMSHRAMAFIGRQGPGSYGTGSPA
ncbi:MAG TPA: hypothetical protein VMW38_17035 [Terriglobia bacterium]|nr:hypothetical protein [Terriglobia bacterium]